MKRVGITGCIGSGKSTISTLLQHMGYPVYNSDDRAKYLMQHDSGLILRIQQLLGPESYTSPGKLNTSWIASKVFTHPSIIEDLNAIVHPAVFFDFEKFTQQHDSAPILFKEAALTFESGSNRLLDFVMCVSAPENIRIERVISRDASTEEAVRSRMDKQFSQEKKEALSDFIIQNDGKQALLPQITSIIQQILN